MTDKRLNKIPGPRAAKNNFCGGLPAVSPMVQATGGGIMHQAQTTRMDLVTVIYGYRRSSLSLRNAAMVRIVLQHGTDAISTFHEFLQEMSHGTLLITRITSNCLQVTPAASESRLGTAVNIFSSAVRHTNHYLNELANRKMRIIQQDPRNVYTNFRAGMIKPIQVNIEAYEQITNHRQPTPSLPQGSTPLAPGL